jgi:hypothetical protein
MGQDPGRLAIVKRGVHLRARRDTRPLMAIQAEPLCVVARLAIRCVREDVHCVSFDEVRVMESPGLRRGVAVSADLFGVALGAIHGAARGQGTVPRREVGRMKWQDDARWIDSKARSHSRSGKHADGGP